MTNNPGLSEISKSLSTTTNQKKKPKIDNFNN